ncbi:MAG: PAS domain-containing protein, partial [Anaerolineales bacterium]
VALPNLVRRAAQTNTVQRQDGLRLETDRGIWRVGIEVTPFAATRASKERYFLVAFQLIDQVNALTSSGHGAQRETPASRALRMADMEQDLTDTQANLLAAGEELDANSAELVAALEELQSANEELQSMNEELQTGKEELQSSNEELTTLNEELENRNQELNMALGTLNNLVESVRLPVLIVGGNLRIRLYNPPAAKVLNIVNTDIGRPIGEVKTRLNISELAPLISGVMRSLQPLDEEVQDREGRWYAMRIRPYQSLDNRIDGVVITWTDVSILKTSLAQMDEPDASIANIAGLVRGPLLILNRELQVQTANASFYDLLQVTPSETEGFSLYELGQGQWNLPELRRLLDELPPGDSPFQALEIDRNFPKIGRRTMLVNARRVSGKTAADELVLLAIEDVTAVRQLTEMEQLRLLSGRLLNVREEERTRLSREIHDELGGMLTGLKLQLFQLRSALNGDQAPQDELILSMAKQIDTEMDFVRRTASSLRPHLLDDMGLVAAIEWQLAEFQRQGAAEVTFRSNVDDLMLSSETQTAVFRILQEALTNAARHSGAPTVEVSLEAREGYLHLVVHDDGRGITPEKLADKNSLGLMGMRERAQQVGGYMDVRGDPGVGTMVRVRVPIRPPEPEAEA